ncbi:GldM family protein [Flavobacterium sp. RHBU_24]|uniref:GldM family protein n=1 Tax=Flavobacterium sp. RHBU_24 TaxID=3391185 RepID=UPI003984D3F2
MKFICALLFCTLTAFAQNDSVAPQNISVISAEKLNVVYRGIDNPIKIAVPGAKSFTATAPGLSPDESKGTGNYILNPGAGTEVIVTLVAQMPDGTSKVEKKAFRILSGIPVPNGVLSNEHSSYYLKTRDELCNDSLSVYYENVLIKNPNEHCIVREFEVRFLSKNRERRKKFTIHGNKFTDDIKKEIQQLKPGDEVLMHNIKCQVNIGLNGLFCKMPLILVEITD